MASIAPRTVEPEPRDRFLVRLDDALRPLTDPLAIAQSCARMLGEHLGVQRCAYASVETDVDTFNVLGDHCVGVPSIVGSHRLGAFGADALAAHREDRPFVSHDVETHEPPIGDISSYRQLRIRAVIAVPLHKAGKFVAGVAVHSTTPRTWTQGDVELVRLVASRSWESIERARVARDLRDSEERFRQLADAMPQILWATSPDGAVEYINRRTFEYFGVPEDSLGDPFFFTDGDARDAVRTAWRESLATGQPYEIECTLRRQDGEARWHHIRALPIRGATGAIVRWFGTCTDIHDQKLLHEQKQRLVEIERAARAETERVGRMKDEFLATLSHELRTPLAAVYGWAQLLRRPSVTEETITTGLAAIERNATAQKRLIEDLLDMSSIISGKVRLDMRPMALETVVVAAVQSVQPTADSKGVALAIVDVERAGTVEGDAARLQQIIWNLLSNAIKFTRAGGKITIAAARVGDTIELSVTDTGKGIPNAFLPHVFDRFAQEDASVTRRYGGLGLGLSIAKQLVEMHNATLRAESPGEGRGATFTLVLPASEGPRRARAESDRSTPPPVFPDLHGIAILVVDDDSDARDILERTLTGCNARVVGVDSAADALHTLSSEPIDLVVSDIGMPDMDGYELAQAIRAHGDERVRNIPAIALTAHTRASDRERALQVGYNGFLSKPVRAMELFDAIARATA